MKKLSLSISYILTEIVDTVYLFIAIKNLSSSILIQPSKLKQKYHFLQEKLHTSQTNVIYVRFVNFSILKLNSVREKAT